MKTLLAGFLLVASRCFADGIPVTDGKVDMPHVVISLNSSQSEEIETLGTLTLTGDQFAKLRAQGPSCPKRFEDVLPVTWDDSTGEMRPYVIQLSKTQAAILLHHVEKPPWTILEHHLSKDGHPHDLDFRADRRGQFYLDGTLIPFPKLLELVKGSDGKAKPGNIPDKLQISVELPVGTSPDSAVFSDRLGKLREAATKAGWDFYAK